LTDDKNDQADHERHVSQRNQLFAWAKNGVEHTLAEGAEILKCPTQSVGSRYRELRAMGKRNGKWTVPPAKRTGDPKRPVFNYRIVMKHEN
jgi:hypothetical protein